MAAKTICVFSVLVILASVVTLSNGQPPIQEILAVPFLGPWIAINIRYFATQYVSAIPQQVDLMFWSAAQIHCVQAYDEKVVGLTSDFTIRRPVSEHTEENLVECADIVTYRLVAYFGFGNYTASRGYVISKGLNPDDTSTAEGLSNPTPTQVGNSAWLTTLNWIRRIGLNPDGTNTRRYNRIRYEDWTGHRDKNEKILPENPGFPDSNPHADVYHPLIEPRGASGTNYLQRWIVPQYARAAPFAILDPNYQYPYDEPPKSRGFQNLQFEAINDEVLAKSAELTADSNGDFLKIRSEFFDNKLASFGTTTFYNHISRDPALRQAYGIDHEWTAKDAILNEFGQTIVLYESARIMTKIKMDVDYVRPQDSIKQLYFDKNITAYPGFRTNPRVMKGREFSSYIRTDAHAEFPSVTTCFAVSLAEFKRLEYGTDFYNRTYVLRAGSSRYEPGTTPANDVVFTVDTWTQFVRDVGDSRIDGGVHFRPAVDAASGCDFIGRAVYDQVRKHINGTALPMELLDIPVYADPVIPV